MSGVRPDSDDESSGPGGTVPTVPHPAPGPHEGQTSEKLPDFIADRIAAPDSAVAQAFAPLQWGEGARIGVLGDSGCGKTHICLALARYYLEHTAGLLIVVDGSGLSPYPGTRVRDVAALAALPTAPRAVIIEGVPGSREADGESASVLQWQCAHRGLETLVIDDELHRLVKRAGCWNKGVVATPSAFTEGRKRKMSRVWGVQSPQNATREPFEQSGGIFCGRLAGRGLHYLDDQGYLDGGAAEILPYLPADEVPGPLRGKFLYLQRGRAWDGRVYDFSRH